MRDIKDLLKELKKLHGESSVRLASELPPVRAFPFGIPSWDLDVGAGALWGRTFLLAGKSGSGKTSMCYNLVGRAQKEGCIVIWFDIEKALDQERAQLLGVDINNLIVYKTIGDIELTSENVFGYARDVIRAVRKSNDKAVFVVDSLAELTPDDLFEKDSTHNFGGSAKMQNQSIRVWNQLIGENQILLLVNQLRDKIGSMGDPDMMPGGRGQEFTSSTIVWMRDGETIKEGNKVIGKKIKWTVKKSRSSSPKEIGEVTFNFATGFDVEENLVDAALELEILERTGAWFKIPNSDEKVNGKDKLVAKLREDKKYLATLWDLVYAKMNKPIWNGDIKE